MAFAKFGDWFKIDGEIAENRAILVNDFNLTASIVDHKSMFLLCGDFELIPRSSSA